MKISRRGLLVGAALGGGLAVAWAVMPRQFSSPLEQTSEGAVFGAWLSIAQDGIVTVAVPQLEMGQGISTILPQIIAHELGADWRQIAIQPAPASGAYANIPLAADWAVLWQPNIPGISEGEDSLMTRRYAEDNVLTITAGGTAVRAFEQPCREAAASARAVLALEAADRWNVAWEECEVLGGMVIHGEKRLSFGELADGAADRSPPDPPPLRSSPPREVPRGFGEEQNTSYRRLDLPAKVDGTYQFAGDIRLPGMLFASVRHGMVGAGAKPSELSQYEEGAIERLRGVRVVQHKHWLATVAKTWWEAEQAFDRLRPKFAVIAPSETSEMEERLDTALREGKTFPISQLGEGSDNFGKHDIARRYDVMPATHATPETATATARLVDGKLELWVASQAPESTRKAVANAVGISQHDVVLYPMPAGGSYDRRLDTDHAVEAALIAREIGKPIQLIWSRWQELSAGRSRAPVSALMMARKGAGGTPQRWWARLAMPAAMREMGARVLDGESQEQAHGTALGRSDPLGCEGALPPYAIPHVAVDHAPAEVDIPVSRMRGGSHGYTAFFNECFIDELAAEANREPLGFRMGMLSDDTRMALCLQRVARLAKWSGGGDSSGQGLACHRIGSAQSGAKIAAIATARAGEGGVRVEKLSAVVDIGRIINLDIAQQQVEGGLLQGLALAVGSGLNFAAGVPQETRLSALNLPSLSDAPIVEVEFIESDAPPADPGEIGLAVAAPAIANALFSATGLRFRRLPLLSGTS